jgi:ornithine decarboxylase
LNTKHDLKDSFYIANLSRLREKIVTWKSALGNVQPYYAVKCNGDKEMMKMMVAEGFGFDVASRREMDMALSVGCRGDKLIYANPVKKISDIRYAESIGIGEIDKLVGKRIGALIRLGVDNPSARIKLGDKYGIRGNKYKEIIDYAKQRGVNIKGACFHVGSASQDPFVFQQAIDYSREVMEYGKTKGYVMDILEIGGGFTGDNFDACAKVIRDSLEGGSAGVGGKVIAEPGRYFAEEVFTFCVPIIGKKKAQESVDGSFNCIIYDQQQPRYGYLKLSSVVYGATCDSFDKLTCKLGIS